jgi:hypothetical protein
MDPTQTAWTMAGVGRLTKTSSVDAATSLADVATAAPRAASGFTASGFVSNTQRP